MTAKFIRLFVFLVLPAVLAACGGYTTKVIDSPQASELKGWQKPYMVNGQRYDPLRSHHGFIENGLASWYGKDFHGKPTSNGEIYNMHAMTAAHKTLPLGVYVKVHNKSNGKEVIVRVNDRGPFVKGRIIDLSYSAAKELGAVGPGTVPVCIEALGYRESGGSGQLTYRVPASYDVGSYAVQVGAFTVADNARCLAAELQSLQGHASVQQGWVNGTLFYRVRVGKYSSLKAAEAAKAGFEVSGYPNSFVVAME